MNPNCITLILFKPYEYTFKMKCTLFVHRELYSVHLHMEMFYPFSYFFRTAVLF